MEHTLTHFTILGERCSGTNFLEEAIINNFNLKITWEFGHKHFFGFNNYKNNGHVLFIGIIRDIVPWLNSFYNQPAHLPKHLTDSTENFLNLPFYSVYGKNDDYLYILSRNKIIEYGHDLFINTSSFYKNSVEIIEDRNIKTKEMYKNIFEMRKVKFNFLYENMPQLVENYIFIRYEDLRDNYETVMNKISILFNLKFKEENIIKIDYYRKKKEIQYVPKSYNIFKEDIIKNHKYYNKEIETKINKINIR
jgi:hypothetical protein